MTKATRNGTNPIQVLIDRHREIEPRVEHYLQLVDDLLHDCEAIMRADIDLFWVVDFSILFDLLFPRLPSRGNAAGDFQSLSNHLRRSLADKILITFFFARCPKKILLRLYAEEFQDFCMFYKSSISGSGPVAWEDLLSELPEVYTYFALWQSDPKSSSSYGGKEVARALSGMIGQSQTRLAGLVDLRSKNPLWPLAHALEGKQSEEISTEGFERLRSEIKGRSISNIERDIKALSLVYALNQQFGRMTTSKTEGNEEASEDSSERTKRFLFLTKDRQILNAVKSLSLDVGLPHLPGGSAEEVTFLRSLDHLLLLYICCGDVEQGVDDVAEQVRDQLAERRYNISEYLKSIEDAKKWLQARERERIIPATVRKQMRDSADLEGRIAGFLDSRELQTIEHFDQTYLFAAREPGQQEPIIPEIGQKKDFDQAVDRILSKIPQLVMTEENPFDEMEDVGEWLDVIIALYDTPTFNRYFGFNYTMPPLMDHPFASELNHIESLLAERNPVHNADGLEQLFGLRKKLEAEDIDEQPKAVRFKTDGFCNAMLSKAYRIQGRLDKAVRVCERALYLRNYRAHHELYFEKGLSRKVQARRLGRKDYLKEAEDCLRKAWESAPLDGRIVHELAVIRWIPVSDEMSKLRNLLHRVPADTMACSHPSIVKLIQTNKKIIVEARDLLGSWQSTVAGRFKNWRELPEGEKAVHIMVSNASAYLQWLLYLRTDDALKRSSSLFCRTRKRLFSVLTAAVKAYDLYRKFDETGSAEVIRLHVLETLIQIRLSLCNLLALKEEISLGLLKDLESNLACFACTPEFGQCYHDVHEDYDKFRRVHLLRLLTKRSGSGISSSHKDGST